MKNNPRRLALLSVLAAATVLAACGRKEEAVAPKAVQAPVTATTAAFSPATACASCHGEQGEGQASAGYPRIGGQSKAYLKHQLDSYADGSRKNPTMEPIAKALSEEQRIAAAEYFAQLAPDVLAATGAGAVASILEAAGGRGKLLAEVGDTARGVQACVECHGVGGVGSPAYPYLAGQYLGYLNSSMNAWRDGIRNNDPHGKMPGIAKGLKPEDIAALAAYYAAQPLRDTSIDAEAMAKAAAQTRILGAGRDSSHPR